jgi:hypothetical protein
VTGAPYPVDAAAVARALPHSSPPLCCRLISAEVFVGFVVFHFHKIIIPHLNCYQPSAGERQSRLPTPSPPPPSLALWLAGSQLLSRGGSGGHDRGIAGSTCECAPPRRGGERGGASSTTDASAELTDEHLHAFSIFTVLDPRRPRGLP